MSDIIDIIDGLHAEATKGPLRRSEASGVIESSDGVFVASGTWPHDGNMLVALVNNWPSISARLREAERERDEWKLASSKNGDAMSGYQSRAIVAEQRLEGAKRERDAALASLAEKRRAIDEAFATLDAGHGMLACREAAHILRPHATKATEAKSHRCCHDCDPVFRKAYGLDDPNPVGNAATPQVSPVGNDDTRELVARLAEVLRGIAYDDDGNHAKLDAIVAAARRGGGA